MPIPITQEENQQDSTQWKQGGLRRSDRVRAMRENDLEHVSVPGLVLGATTRLQGYAAANHYLQMKEWAFKEYFAGAITCKETGQALEYRDLMKRPELKDTWERSFANELGRLAQGIRDVNDINTIIFILKSPKVDSQT